MSTDHDTKRPHPLSPDAAAESGLYYDEAKPKRASSVATPELAAELWERSEAWVNEG